MFWYALAAVLVALVAAVSGLFGYVLGYGKGEDDAWGRFKG